MSINQKHTGVSEKTRLESMETSQMVRSIRGQLKIYFGTGRRPQCNEKSHAFYCVRFAGDITSISQLLLSYLEVTECLLGMLSFPAGQRQNGASH